ncbi:hypothetical protein P4H71_01475 [Paenibacillus kribbensis]|uniref:hypothetical protein n=1 Tax=Paenibacillus kribbensis TaxID=172713 RepID=UPI002DBDB6E2|nr:hypothetical protein [Paenibacillus kribbensis]MEC0233027.1 hypothetical protein [Paenibacillus kribbensis]
MKKLLSIIFITVLCLSLPFTALADEVETDNVPKEFTSQFMLVEDSANNSGLQDAESLEKEDEHTQQNNVAPQAASPVGGFGTINCKAIGSGQMNCNWSITLTKRDEAIQSIAAIFDVKNSSGAIVGQKDYFRTLSGTNYKTHRDQIMFTPGVGTFTVEKYGAVEGRYAVYHIVAVTGDDINVY